MPSVATVSCEDYDTKLIVEAVQKGLRLVREKPKRNDRVLLKVNLLYGAEPEKVVNTNPVFVGAVIKVLKAIGCKVSVGDSPALTSFMNAAEQSGIANVCRKYGAGLVELGSPVTVKTKGGLVKSLILTKRLADFDYIINLPKLKTHSLTGVTGAVKNTFGFVPGREKGLYHLRFKKPEHFAQLLCDICRHIGPRLTIMDAVYAMEGCGPGQGTPRKLGKIIISDDCFAADVAAMRLIGFNKNENTITKHCSSAWINYRELVQSPALPAVRDFKRTQKTGRLDILWSVLNLFGGLATQKPHVLNSCVGCGDCARACPAGAISILRKKAVIDRKKCILCHCCHEVCRYHSMALKCSLPGRVLRKLAL